MAIKFSVLLVVLGIIFSGCANRNGKDKVTIYYAGLGDAAEMKVIDKSIDLFEKEHPNIKVEFLHTPGNAYWDKLETMIAGGSKLDVMYIGGEKFIEFAHKNIFYPLNDLIKKNKINMNKFFKNVVKVIEYKHNIYAIPRDVAPYVIFYNKDMFDRAGVNYISYESSSKEFVQKAKLLTDKKAHTYGLVISIWWGYYIPLVQAYNGKIIKNNRLNINDATVRKALKEFVSYFRENKIAPNLFEMKDNDLFGIGKAAMTMTGFWMIPTFKHYNFKWDIVLFPKYKKRVAPLSYTGYAIYRGTKHLDEAFEFVKFMTSEKIQKINAEAGLSMPSLKSLAKSDWFLSQSKYNKAFVDSMRYAEALPFKMGWTEIGQIMDRYMEAIIIGKISFDRGLAQMKKEVDAILKKYYK